MKTLPVQTASWHVVYTKPRSEKKAASRLEQQGIEVYCPTYTTLRQWSDRKKKVTLPVFSSYLFVKVAEKERHTVLQDPQVLNFVFWQGKPGIAREEEIQALRDLLGGLASGEEVEVVEMRAGQEVRVSEGAFQGCKATISKVGKQQAYVRIESIRAVVRVKKASLEAV